MDEKKAIERQKKAYAYTNRYNQANYDRVSVLLPKGTKERIQATGEPANAMIKRLLLEELDKLGV